MGNNLNKIRADQHSMICPAKIINPNEAGCIYFVQHAPKTELKDNESQTTKNQIGKTSHFSIAIDITGTLK